ncbi:MAG: hypothetical protein AVDCRST_MAG14-1461 [uncultured Rubrobacteraceae bacterium]|uniref:Uncharacterized protein n=1 Tax=uncultured Rubrobacteraceae bacterium TaxID=349277 RepID=A0A6J4R034_9ACTN|nr:MAG: hypothetical protein AVDCRST_MAG14-1461 [uncultured Rubrobacteraceae bacterium]
MSPCILALTKALVSDTQGREKCLGEATTPGRVTHSRWFAEIW